MPSCRTKPGQTYPTYDKATRPRAPLKHSLHLLPPNFDTALGTSLQLPGGNPCSPKLPGAVLAFLRVLQGSWGRVAPRTVFCKASPRCAYPGPQTLSCPLTAEQPAWKSKSHFPGCPIPRKLKGWWQKFRLRSKRKAGASTAAGQAPWEADYELLPCEGLFDEYLEMGRCHSAPPASTLLSTSPLKRDVGPWWSQACKGSWKELWGQSGEHPGKVGRGWEGPAPWAQGLGRGPGAVDGAHLEWP